MMGDYCRRLVRTKRHPVPLLSGAVSRRIRQPSVLPDAGAFSSLITYLAFDERVGLGLDDRIPSPSGIRSCEIEFSKINGFRPGLQQPPRNNPDLATRGRSSVPDTIAEV